MTAPAISHPAGVVHPSAGTVPVPDELDLVQVLRVDTAFAVRLMLRRLGAVDLSEPRRTAIAAAYREFVAALARAFIAALPGRRAQVHLFDADDLTARVRLGAGDLPVVSMDPLYRGPHHEFAMSRVFLPGGITARGCAARPGTPPLTAQAAAIRRRVGSAPVCLVDDDLVTGGTLTTAVDALRRNGIDVRTVLTSLQVGDGRALARVGRRADTAVRYIGSGGAPPRPGTVDLTDPRDFVLGLDGLVVALPDGSAGRAPYHWPFVSTSERASIAPGCDASFAVALLAASSRLYRSVSALVGRQVRVRHTDPYFAAMVRRYYGVPEGMPMTELADQLVAGLDELWRYTRTLGAKRVPAPRRERAGHP